MPDVEVTLDYGGVSELLRLDPVLHVDLLARAHRVYVAAQVDNPRAVLSIVDEITDRERVRIVDSGSGAMYRAASTGRLLKALGAAGGA